MKGTMAPHRRLGTFPVRMCRQRLRIRQSAVLYLTVLTAPVACHWANLETSQTHQRRSILRVFSLPVYSARFGQFDQTTNWLNE